LVNPVNAALVPAAGSPLACHVPFLLKNNLPLSASKAIPIISPAPQLSP